MKTISAKMVQAVMAIAQDHAYRTPLGSSAREALKDATICVRNGSYQTAMSRALKSLRNSIGVSHPDYEKALEIYRG